MGFMLQDQQKKKVVVISLDGWGASSGSDLDIFDEEKAPYLSSLLNSYPSTQLATKASVLGFKQGPTNKEMGQQALAGALMVSQESSLLKNEALMEALKILKKNQAACQIILSIDDSSEWSITYLKIFLELAKRKKLAKVNIHAVLREVVSWEWWQELELLCQSQVGVSLVSVMGADYAGNNNYDWQKTRLTYQHLTKKAKAQKLLAADLEQGRALAPKWLRATEQAGSLSKDDVVLVCDEQVNDAWQLVNALTAKQFDIFKRDNWQQWVVMSVGKVAEDLSVIDLLPRSESLVLEKIVAAKEMRQIMMTEGYGSLAVNYYALGGLAPREWNHDYKIVNSPFYGELTNDIGTGTRALTQEMNELLVAGDHDLIWLDLPVLDLAGEIGGGELMAKSLPEVDELLAKIINKAISKDYLVLLTASCARSEAPVDVLTGQERRVNSEGAVPLILIAKELEGRNWGELERAGDLEALPSLLNVAPTILQCLGLEVPEELSAKGLL
jgi:2,3-bisphosphoglycerate-independent phosphoglycerate mutase